MIHEDCFFQVRDPMPVGSWNPAVKIASLSMGLKELCPRGLPHHAVCFPTLSTSLFVHSFRNYARGYLHPYWTGGGVAF